MSIRRVYAVFPPRSLALRGALVGGLTLGERILTAGAAWALLERDKFHGLLIAGVLAVFFTVRSFAERVSAVTAETELAHQMVVSLLDGDVVASHKLAEAHVHVQIAQAAYETAQLVAVDVPALCGNALATLAIAALAANVARPKAGVEAGVAAMVALTALAFARRQLEGSVSRAWAARERVLDVVEDAIKGRLEIVASGQRGSFLQRATTRMATWRGAAQYLAASTLLSGRIPLVAIAAAIGAFLALTREGTSVSATIAELAFLATLTPAFAGVVQGVAALSRSQRWAQVVAGVVAPVGREQSGTLAPPRNVWPIVFQDVSFDYPASAHGNPALVGLTATWQHSPMLALAGPNGSGKSTCLRLLLGLVQPAKGTIEVHGIPLRSIDLDPWRSTIAFLPQRPYLPDRADIREAIHLLVPRATDDAIRSALRRVGFPSLESGSDVLERRVDELSLGERQRVALARIYCSGATLFLLDEPEANLDQAGVEMVADLLRELAGRGGVAFAAHSERLLSVAGQVLRLRDGRLESSVESAA
ncbi:MAG: ATP-binding cassette domain-containing protein [Polyangiaceae bacterium]